MGSGKGKSKRVSNKSLATASDIAGGSLRTDTSALDVAEPTILEDTDYNAAAFYGEDFAFGMNMAMANREDLKKCPLEDCGAKLEPGAKKCPKCNFRIDGPQLFESTFAEFRETSSSLGIPIPKHDPFYIADDSDVVHAKAIMHNALSDGRRAFWIYGPPGTGKNTFIRQVLGAPTGMPVLEIDLAASDELEALIGYDGLENEDGATITVQKRGKLTTAAERGCIIVLNELVEVPKGQLTQIHNMVGSGIADDERCIVIKSASNPEGETVIKLHPDTIIVCTSNPGLNDARLHDALASRMVSMYIGHGTEESQQAKLASLANSVLTQSPQDIEEGKKPTPTQVEWKKLRENAGKKVKVEQKEVEQTVKFFNHIHHSWEEGGGDIIRHEPDFRTFTTFEVMRLKQTEREAYKERPTQLPLYQLDFMFDQSTLKPAERRAKLQKEASGFFADAGITKVSEEYLNNN